MATNELQFPGDLQVESIILKPVPGTYTGPLGQEIDIRELMVEMSIYESILSPTISADILLSDSGKNLISNIPLLGQEQIQIKMGSAKGKKYTLEFIIHKISGRTLDEKNQVYILHLCSVETLINECVRLSQRFKGKKTHELVESLLVDTLKTKKKFIKDDSLYPIDFVVPFWRPFDTALWIARRSVAVSKSDSCGFLFWENFEGYNFKSIDNMISAEPKVKEIFTYAPAKTEDNPDKKLYRIKSFRSPEVFNHLMDLRNGVYSHYSINLDFLNSTKTTRRMTIDEWWQDSSHLNKCRPYRSTGQGNLNPPSFSTRVIYRPIANQLWDEPGATNSSPNSTENADKMNEMFEKAIFRYHMLNYNKLDIEVPGNMELRAGDVVEISIPSPEKGKEGDDSRKEDKRLSGKYLIESLRHSLNKSQLFTNVTLIRDSFGGESITDPKYPILSTVSTLGENSSAS